MGTVTISVASLEDVERRVAGAFSGKPQGEHITFLTVGDMMRVLTVRRWEMIQAMVGRGVMSVRAVARLVDRDVKDVHGDVQALLLAGVLDKADGGVVFPYDAAHVDFTFGKAA
jgi:predicted transcriptional regulator